MVERHEAVIFMRSSKHDWLFANRILKIFPINTEAPMKNIMVLAAVSRAFVFATAVATNALFGARSCGDCWNIGVPFFNLFSRWDSGYYGYIALGGYSNLVGPNWAFFPGYPILISIFGRLIGILFSTPLHLGVYLAGFVISNLAFLGSVYYLYKLSELVLGNTKLAYNSALFLAFYPAGIFLSAVYSDSIFLMLTISSLYYWRLAKLRRSAALGFFASLTRPVGIFLLVPYLYELLVNSSRRKVRWSYLPMVSILLGYLSFMAYSQFMTGTPFANFEAGRLFWGMPPDLKSKLVLADMEIHANPIIVPYLALSMGAIVAAISKVRSRAETAIVLYAICLLIAYLLTPVDSFPRYSITLLPIYWSVSRLSQCAVAKIVIYGVFLVLLAVGTALFVNWYSFY